MIPAITSSLVLLLAAYVHTQILGTEAVGPVQIIYSLVGLVLPFLVFYRFSDVVAERLAKLNHSKMDTSRTEVESQTLALNHSLLPRWILLLTLQMLLGFFIARIFSSSFVPTPDMLVKLYTLDLGIIFFALLWATKNFSSKSGSVAKTVPQIIGSIAILYLFLLAYRVFLADQIPTNSLFFPLAYFVLLQTLTFRDGISKPKLRRLLSLKYQLSPLLLTLPLLILALLGDSF